MKKLLLAFLFIATLCNANHYIIIDSISPKAPCLYQRVKVYCHDSVGTWFGSEQVAITNNSTTVHTGTHQDLVDSGYVWSFIYIGSTTVQSDISFASPYGFNIITIPPYICTVAIETYVAPNKKDDYFYYDMGLFQMRINLRTKEKEILLN